MPDNSPHNPSSKSTSPLSLQRLRQAFAEMLGGPRAPEATTATNSDSSDITVPVAGTEPSAENGPDPCEINPRSIVEAMLFVGHPDNRPLTAREMAAVMRGVSPNEVEQALAELNDRYNQDEVPYRIVAESGGYRLALREEFYRMRDKFYGRVREAKLSPAVLEVLALVAYHEPITLERINQIRGAASGGPLSTLVRRGLVRLERLADRPRKPDYYTTDRFLRLFRLQRLDDLPRTQELHAA